MTHLYAPMFRPPGFATVPNGWTLVERGTGGHFPLRPDLPEGSRTFGVIAYPQPLAPHDIEAYELLVLGTA